MEQRLEGDGRVSSQIDKEGKSLSPQMHLLSCRALLFPLG